VLATSLGAGAASGWGQEEVPTTLPAEVDRSLRTVNGRDIIAHARALSDPKYRGREASSTGAHEAARYIAEEFRRLGLRPGGSAGSYYQVFKIRPGYQIASELTFRIGKTPVDDFKRGHDYMPAHLPGGKAEVEAECVFAGYGISAPKLEFDEYGGPGVKGKAVLVFSGVPWPASAESWLGLGAAAAKFGTIGYKARNAAAHGAACLFLVDNPAGWRRDVKVPERLRIPDTSWPLKAEIPVVHITRGLLAEVMKMSVPELRMLAADIARQRTAESMSLRGRRVRFKAMMTGRARLGRNVVGVLPGRDGALKTQAVVIGAHYDHLGEGEERTVYYGANDNAAGVGAMLAVARAFAALPTRPRRTMVFAAFDAEEIGRRGSKHYVSRPAVPVGRTSLMINFDVIGRIRVIVHRGRPSMAMLRLPTQESRGRANLHQGAVGVGVDIATGRTVAAVCHDRAVTAHPDTGASIVGIEIPHWSDVLIVATKLSRALELGYVGVDIVLDARTGPVVLGANARPALAIQIANGCGLLPRLLVDRSGPRSVDALGQRGPTSGLLLERRSSQH
jgi:hypothetical protein